MAKWVFGMNSEDSKIVAGIDIDEKDNQNYFEVRQDIEEIMKEVKRDKEIVESGQNKLKTGYRKMCTIPDVVAIEMLMKHKLDIHDSNFMSDSNNMKRLRYILKTEYPHLLIST